jgi:hypothetical protein
MHSRNLEKKLKKRYYMHFQNCGVDTTCNVAKNEADAQIRSKLRAGRHATQHNIHTSHLMPTLISAPAIFLFFSWEKTLKTRRAIIIRIDNAALQLLLLLRRACPRRALRPALPRCQAGRQGAKGQGDPLPDTRTQNSLYY